MEISKKNIILAMMCAVSILFASVSLLFAGCGTSYTSKPGTKQEMAGTYQLTTYIQKDSEGNEVNRIEQLHVKAYMVVGTDGYGFYAYQDDNTEFWYDSTYIEYNKADNQPDLYKSIRFTTGKGNVTINKQKPGCGYEPTMGFNVDQKTFNYFIPDDKPTQKWLYPSYYTDVVYTKISEDTNLTKIASELNTTLSPLPKYDLKNLDGVLIFRAGMPNNELAPDVVNNEYNKYKYYVVNFNAAEQKADIYYELVAGDEGAQVQNDVALDIAFYPADEQTGVSNHVTIKFFNNEYYANLGSYKMPSFYLNYGVFTDFDETGTSYEIYNNYFEKYFGDKTDILDIVAQQLEDYNNSLS